MSKVTVGLKLAGDLVISVGNVSQTLNGFTKNIIQVADGHGITEVDQDFWEQWLKANANTKLVKRGLIFAQASERKAKDEAKEKKENKSGTEKLKKDAGVEPHK